MSKVVLMWAFAALCLAMGASAQQALEMVWSFPSAQPCNTPTLWHDELFDITKSTPERAGKLAYFKSTWGHLSTWVYVACADGSLSALNTTTSAVGWSIQLGGGSVVTDPAISHDGYIYVGTSQGMVYKVDTIGGVVEWNYTSSRGIAQQSPISLGGSALVFGNELGRTVWLDLATGQQLHVATGSTIPNPTPIIYEGFVAHSDDMQVWVDDALTSNLLYKFIHGTGTFHRVLGLGSNFYAPNDGGFIYVFQCASGTLVTKIPCQTAKPLTYADGSIIAVTQNGNVAAYSESNSTKVWETSGGQFTSPATASGTVPSIGVIYVGSGSGLVALNTTNGDTVGIFKTNTAITRAPGVQYGVGDIYIATQQGIFRLRGPRA